MIPFKGSTCDTGMTTAAAARLSGPQPAQSVSRRAFHQNVDGHVKIGPTAIPAFWRETTISGTVSRCGNSPRSSHEKPGSFLFNHFNFRRLAFDEIRKYRRRFFIDQARGPQNTSMRPLRRLFPTRHPAQLLNTRPANWSWTFSSSTPKLHPRSQRGFPRLHLGLQLRESHRR